MISFVALAAGERRPGANLIQGWCEKGVPVAASIRGIFPSLVNDDYPLQDRIFGLGSWSWLCGHGCSRTPRSLV